jgi:hypothetical protein
LVHIIPLIDYGEASEETIRWFLDVIRSAVGRDLIQPRPGAFVTAIATAEKAVKTWQRSHDHDLHTISTMTPAVADHFTIEDTCAVLIYTGIWSRCCPQLRPPPTFCGESSSKRRDSGHRKILYSLGVGL